MTRNFYHNVDLQGRLDQAALGEGNNVMHEFATPGGVLRLIAVVKDGKITDWVGTDHSGKAHRAGNATVDKPVGGHHAMTCWKCVLDADGNEHCFLIACPKGPFRPVPPKPIPPKAV
jgi:hypothetical protein